MPSPTQEMVRAMLRETEALSVAELLERAPDWRPPRSKDRKGALRNAIANDQLVGNRGDGRYVYLPRALTGATMRVPVIVAEGRLVVGEEVPLFLWPLDDERWGEPTATFALAGGPTVAVFGRHRFRRDRDATDWETPRDLIEPEAPFWAWWRDQQASGADALVLRCQDHEAGRFAVRAIRSGDLDPRAVAASNATLRETAGQVLKGTDGMLPWDLGRRLLARGVYQLEPPPDPLFQVLLAPDSTTIVDRGYRIVSRPDLTPPLQRLFADRIQQEREGPDLGAIVGLFSGTLPLADEDDPAADQEVVAKADAIAAPPATTVYRIKVVLAWDKTVWRTIEQLDSMTLEDLHDAIQDAFGWDDEHLYAFYLSGRFGDYLTEVGRPTGEDFDEPPTADQILLAQLELRPGQRLAYRYNFFHDYDHHLEIESMHPFASEGTFPRVVERRGKAVIDRGPDLLLLIPDDFGWTLGELDEGARP